MEGAGGHSTTLARQPGRAFSFRFCRRLSLIALLVTTVSRYLSRRLTPARLPLYWFLLGLQSLITYTCSWEMQAWRREKAPSMGSPLPQQGPFWTCLPGAGLKGGGPGRG